MAPSGFLSRLTKRAESQDLRLESLDVRKAILAKVLARAAPGLRCLFRGLRGGLLVGTRTAIANNAGHGTGETVLLQDGAIVFGGIC
jgi:hypothetical protein